MDEKIWNHCAIWALGLRVRSLGCGVLGDGYIGAIGSKHMGPRVGMV